LGGRLPLHPLSNPSVKPTGISDYFDPSADTAQLSTLQKNRSNQLNFDGRYRLFSRHAITSFHITRYGSFSGFRDYAADTPNPNGSIDLWPIQFADYAADTRKVNVHNDLCQSSILATGCGAVRARRSHVLIDEMGRAGGI
jgi:hypothetical protein